MDPSHPSPSSLALPPQEDSARRQLRMSQEASLTRCRVCWCLGLRFPSHQKPVSGVLSQQPKGAQQGSELWVHGRWSCIPPDSWAEALALLQVEVLVPWAAVNWVTHTETYRLTVRRPEPSDQVLAASFLPWAVRKSSCHAFPSIFSDFLATFGVLGCRNATPVCPPLHVLLFLSVSVPTCPLS